MATGKQTAHRQDAAVGESSVACPCSAVGKIRRAPTIVSSQATAEQYMHCRTFNECTGTSLDSGVTFDAWYDRYKGIIKHDGASLDDRAKTRLMASKFSIVAFQQFTAHVLPER